MQSSNSGNLYYRTRKEELYNKGLIYCDYCKFHRNENWKRKPKPDKYKNKNRQKITQFLIEIEIEEYDEDRYRF